jgi:hypothetical protein
MIKQLSMIFWHQSRSRDRNLFSEVIAENFPNIGKDEYPDYLEP